MAMTWRQEFIDRGYALFPDLTPPPLIIAARDAIEHDLAVNYDSKRQVEYDNQSFCPDLVGSPQIMDLLVKSPMHSILDELFGIDNLWLSKGQIAIRRAHNNREPIPPAPHLDGFSSG